MWWVSICVAGGWQGSRTDICDLWMEWLVGISGSLPFSSQTGLLLCNHQHLLWTQLFKLTAAQVVLRLYLYVRRSMLWWISWAQILLLETSWVLCRRNSNMWWIQSVYVKPKYRRMGVFKKLFEHVKDAAKSAGAGSECLLCVFWYNSKISKISQEDLAKWSSYSYPATLLSSGLCATACIYHSAC